MAVTTGMPMVVNRIETRSVLVFGLMAKEIARSPYRRAITPK